MRIVVSGTHATGKSTLVADLAGLLDDVVLLPDPFEDVEAGLDEPDADTFHAQLVTAARRLREPYAAAYVLAERGPLDLVAYLDALVLLDRGSRSPELADRGREIAADVMAAVDLVVLLRADDTREPEDEDPELRAVVDDVLADLLDDPDLVADAEVVEVRGDPEARVRAVRSVLADLAVRGR